MPTYAKTVLQINASKDEVAEILNFVKTEKSCFDFNAVIPMPEELNIISGGLTGIGITYYRLKLKKATQLLFEDEARHLEAIEQSEDFEKIKEKGKKAMFNFLNYGYPTWFEWCVNCWGTKWNASDIEIKDNEISFQTAWTCPKPVLIALSKKFSKINFSFKYASKDLGRDLGAGNILNGIITESTDIQETECSKQKFAIDLWGLQDEYELVDGKYVDKEDEE